MTITKTAMGKLFADLNPEDVGAIAAALADFARANRPNSGHRLPEALAARFRDFAVECGVDETVVTVTEPSFGFCAVRFNGGADFFAALRTMGLADGMVQAELAVNGPAELIFKCADAPEAAAATAAAAPGPAPLVPAVAAAFLKAADRFLEELGPLANMPSDICTPEGWYDWAGDEYADTDDDAPDPPHGIDVGEFATCLRELRTYRTQQILPSLSAIETALIYLGMAPKRPGDLDREFYALSFNADQPTIGRYVVDGETLPDFRLLLADLPGQQFRTAPLNNPLRRPDYLSGNAAQLEALRQSRGAAAFVCFGSAFLARKDPEALAFASDAKAFWDYVRELYTQWIAYGDPDIGVALRDNTLKLVFHPFSRIGVRRSSDNRCGSYADVSETYAVDHAMVGCVAGDHDSDLRSGEFDYTGTDDEDDDDRDARFEREHTVFESTAAAAVYGFAVVPGVSDVIDGIDKHDAFRIVRDRAPAAQLAAEDDESTDDRIGVGDLPLEWSALIHGFDVRTVPELRGLFGDGWANRVCWAGDTSTGFPVDKLDNAGCKLAQPNMSEFLSETLSAFRTMADNSCATVPVDDQCYTVAEAHDRNKYVTAVYTGMTVSTSPAFDLGETPETFSVPALLCSDIVGRQSSAIADNIDPEGITNWLEHLSAHPEVQLKCAKRKSGDTSSRMAWVVVETNLPFDAVRCQCNNLYLGDSARYTRDVVRSLFADTVIRGARDPFNRFFQATPVERVGDDSELASVAAMASGCQNPGAAARVVMSQVPSMFTAENVGTAWFFNPDELRKHVYVSFTSDLYNRLVLVVAVDGAAAQVARLRYRAANPDNPRFGVFTASMMRAYSSMLDNPGSPFDVYIPPNEDWTDARTKMFRAVAGAARYGNVLEMDPPCGGLTTLMLAPRGDYIPEEAFPRGIYAPAPGVHVVNGGIGELRGFQSDMPF